MEADTEPAWIEASTKLGERMGSPKRWMGPENIMGRFTPSALSIARAVLRMGQEAILQQATCSLMLRDQICTSSPMLQSRNSP